MKKFFKGLSVALFFVCLALLITCGSISMSMPSTYYVTNFSENQTEFSFPVSLHAFQNSAVTATSLSNDKKEFNGDLMLMNIIPLKNIKIDLINEHKIIPCGTPFGVKMFTAGVIVVKIDDINYNGKTTSPGKNAGLKKGDIISKINNTKIDSNETFMDIMSKNDGSPLHLEVFRNGTKMNLTLKPAQTSEDGDYKAGIWIRDSSAGIGTITFYDPFHSQFGALGHGICDVDTGDLMPLAHGEIVGATISSVTKGVPGSPGGLNGYFKGSSPIANVEKNCSSGLYGVMQNCPSNNKPIDIAMKQEIKTGYAQILTTINGETPKYYDIQIESINYKDTFETKNMVIKITDPELLKQTGGIVQGMSGSPIIQNGKFVGAVTHVFINDPTQGYGIFAEKMMENINENSKKSIAPAA
ncbi:MAG: SpoIVB peptidase [Bacillota bacterium]|nr:SpoIVB peptidase [Bacillota bacterium]